MSIVRRSRSRLLGLAAAGLLIAVLMPLLFGSVEFLGRNIPSMNGGDRVTDYLKGWLLAFSLWGGLFFFPVSGGDRKNLLLLWGAKVFVTLLAMLFYEANYGIDAYWYFERSQDRFPNFAYVQLGNGTDNMAALLWSLEHWVLHTGSFHFLKVFFAFLGLLGIYFFYRGLKKLLPALPERFLLVLGLCPSILFWSSTLGKDSLTLLGISLAFYGLLRLNSTKNPFYLLAAGAGLFIVAMMRTWIVPLLLIPFFFGQVASISNRILRIFVITVLLGVGYYFFRDAAAFVALENTEQLVRNVGEISRAWQRGGSAGDVPVIRTLGDALRFLPVGMFTALFRPLPGEVMNPFGLLAGLENLALLYLLLQVIRRWRSWSWRDPLFIWIGTYVLGWSMLYAFISPQNLGAAVRFRLQVMPQLIFLFCYLAYFQAPDEEDELTTPGEESAP